MSLHPVIQACVAIAAAGWVATMSIGRAGQSSGAQSPECGDQPPASAPAATARLQRPALKDPQAAELTGLHNVVAFYDDFYSGGVPEGDAGFDTLVELGVKTIISVDGAVPDLDRAKARGLRYIHLPIGYNGFDDARKLQLVRATRDAMQQGPVYLHCHHGRHRSAGAAGAVAVSLNWLTPEQAVGRMNVSGTAPNYKGLYACAGNATVIDVAVIDAVPADFPEVSHPPSFIRAMVEIDTINDHLKLIEKAGWVAPPDHPDLVPAAEAGRFADLFRFAAASEKTRTYPPDFAATLLADAERITALEALLADGEKDVQKMSEQFKAIQASCKDCHTRHRD
jgi:hypothetical protein